jgi:Ser-tRNA(Ala) deacylase AlaX
MAKDYDPRMHSAEHILNQTMVRMFDCGRSFSAHIEKRKSKCDYHFDRNLTTEEVQEIEQRVNDVIAEDMTVTDELVTRSEASRLFNLDRLPAEAGDQLRIVRIGSYDACPCRGQHVHSTKEIGEFSIISTSYEHNVLRLRFKVADPPENAPG